MFVCRFPAGVELGGNEQSFALTCVCTWHTLFLGLKGAT